MSVADAIALFFLTNPIGISVSDGITWTLEHGDGYQFLCIQEQCIRFDDNPQPVPPDLVVEPDELGV